MKHMKKMVHDTLRYVLGALSSLFLRGFFTILPITLTLVIFTFSFRLLESWLTPIAAFKPAVLQKIPHAEIFIVIGLVLLLGAVMRFFVIAPLIHAFEGLIFKLPLVRPVYSGVKQLVNAFSSQDQFTFKKVVLVEFPRPGIYSIGFLTSEIPALLAPEQKKIFFNVFIPTTPNPTSGFLVVVPENDLKSIDLTRQEAMALVISGGIIQPERFLQKQSCDFNH